MYKRGSSPLNIRVPLMSTSTGPCPSSKLGPSCLEDVSARGSLSTESLRSRRRSYTRYNFKNQFPKLEFPVYKFQNQVRYLSVPARKLPGQLGALPLPRIKQEHPATHSRPRRLHTKFKIKLPDTRLQSVSRKCNSTYSGIMLRYSIIRSPVRRRSYRDGLHHLFPVRVLIAEDPISMRNVLRINLLLLHTIIQSYNHPINTRIQEYKVQSSPAVRSVLVEPASSGSRHNSPSCVQNPSKCGK